MRRTLFALVSAAMLAAPVVASAVEPRMDNDGNPQRLSTPSDRIDRRVNAQQWQANQPHSTNPSLGNGMMNGNEPGHVDSPGKNKIDPESRGPINDVDPGRGTDDTRQSANPPPAR